eukprot:228457-Lingulodinium_polyedra.AAC.1
MTPRKRASALRTARRISWKRTECISGPTTPRPCASPVGRRKTNAQHGGGVHKQLSLTKSPRPAQWLAACP